MYIVMSLVRFVMKNMRLSKDFWDFIVETIIYTKNRTITINENDNETITLYEEMNNVVSNVSNLRALDCKTYTHVSKTTSRHKLDDRCWKSIHVDYEKNNQWKIYDSIIKKMHLIRNVKFDENYNYYDVDTTSSKNLNEEELLEIEEFWSFDDDTSLDIQRRFRLELNAFMIFESLIEN